MFLAKFSPCDVRQKKTFKRPEPTNICVNEDYFTNLYVAKVSWSHSVWGPVGPILPMRHTWDEKVYLPTKFNIKNQVNVAKYTIHGASGL